MPRLHGVSDRIAVLDARVIQIEAKLSLATMSTVELSPHGLRQLMHACREPINYVELKKPRWWQRAWQRIRQRHMPRAIVANGVRDRRARCRTLR